MYRKKLEFLFRVIELYKKTKFQREYIIPCIHFAQYSLRILRNFSMTDQHHFLFRRLFRLSLLLRWLRLNKFPQTFFFSFQKCFQFFKKFRY